ncbi:phospholipid scramblase 1-like [Ambystoma mexicanum]|uniref:phospholipid scramblase 1-like n=1 Tax=Ambystoma mexicanum TaxID=8296 RepID=UPI0037E76125
MAYQGGALPYQYQPQGPLDPSGMQYQPQYQPQGQSAPSAMQYQPLNQPQGYPNTGAGHPQGHPQPDPQSFLPAPYVPALPNIPPGLEYLTQLNQVLIHQKRRSMFQCLSEYEILNSLSQKMFHATEEKECWGPQIDIRVFDNSQSHVLHLLLPSQCCNWVQELEVYSPTSGVLIGYVVKNWQAFSISFSILNVAKEMVLKVVGPGFGSPAFSDINFEVKTSNESHTVGRITKVWRGFRKEMFSSNDHYSVQFPMDLDVKVKALLLSTGLFIDFLYYDERRRNNS